jgi:DNA repair protein RecO (recombination protein O)
MPTKESEAIILRTYPLGEGDRLVSFLDRQAGRMRGVARGARMPKSRFGSTLEILSYVRIWYFERESRDLVRISQCELLESFFGVEREYDSGIVLALISEVTEAVLAEKEPADAHFRLALLAARALKQHAPLPAVLAYFSLWTLRLGGWLGSLNSCSHCGRQIGSESSFFSLSSTGLFCGDCRQPGMKNLSPLAMQTAREILAGNFERFLKSNSPLAGMEEIASYALDILEHHSERKFVTRKLLDASESGSVDI